MVSFIITVIVVFHTLLQPSTQQSVDRTLQREASGADVVRAVVIRIEAVFGTDRQFLRRLAFVESNDGMNSNTYRSGYHGGIWQVDEAVFRDTQSTGFNQEHQQIMAEFGINWRNIQWSDLRIPLYSGLAARLFLLSRRSAIPCDVSGQASYWVSQYNRGGSATVQRFIQGVEDLRRQENCQVNSDIMFVLDDSGSIGSTNFNFVRNFAAQLVSELEIGPDDNRVGVITFSSTAQLQFGLDRYRDSSSLQLAMSNIRYRGSGTNIPAALCELITAFNSSSGARTNDASVFRLAILMTDGQSGESSNHCNFLSVLDAARAVHAVSPTILVFAFGVGSNYNRQDVINIASGPEYVSTAQLFSTSQLDCVRTLQEDAICHSITVPVDLDEMIMGSLDEGEQIRWQFTVPESGRLFILEVDEGRVLFYASTQTTAPNEAFHEWKIDSSMENSVYIEPMGEQSNTGTTVYTTLVGQKSGRNTFTLSGAAKNKQEVGKILLMIIAVLVWSLF